ncbi:MAG: HAMP domain-containing sensor histidine kinase [Candidatus Lustribacter sp.]
MIALRRRLTISYTVLVGSFIALVAVAAAVVAFAVMARQAGAAISSGASEARAMVASAPQISVDAVAARTRRDVGGADVDVYVAHPPGAPPDLGAPPLGPPPAGGPPGFAGPNGPGPPGGNPVRPFEWFTTVRGEFVLVGDAQVAIVPDRESLDARGRDFLGLTALAVVLGFVGAWLIARRMAAQIVAPLVAVSAELRRFAAGDFAPNNVPLGRFSDVGELIDAYNGAAAQVTAAFDERERAEGRMRRFLADAGHEMRTPLSVITAYIDILRKGGSEDAQLRAQAFSTLASETLRMRRLVDRLVALARLEQPETTQPVPVDVGVLAHDAVAAIVAARGGDVSCEVESGTYVRADPADLHEAIGNLVDNAVKYGAGSLVRVMVEHEREAVVVRVSDCGPGIDPAERERIFERFYRGAAQQDADGSGLGLAIAARAATRAGGELALERSGDGETVFALRLPLHIAADLT